ncbi:hypothetical protein FBUS_07076 [Fasciolopsis buskii]|uniref:BAG domain-containing protein n=1 Tax=Fasciolopsis buskii TaxID=27845 RepID=A0A8E0VJ14_9TREM|nr:hypothetical protein FBUS_07076 [Fasciolopsis buski]
MAGSGIPPDWTRGDPYYEAHNRMRLDPVSNRYLSRPDVSPSDRTFGTSPYYEDRVQMPGFPSRPVFDTGLDFPSMPADPMWSDFDSEFRQPRPQTSSSSSGLRRIPIQVVKHPVTVIPSTSTSASHNPPISTQTVSPSSDNLEYQRCASNACPSSMQMTDDRDNRDTQIKREWYQPMRVLPKDQFPYQNNGTSPRFAQNFPTFPTRRGFQRGSCSPDMFTEKELPSSASDTDYTSRGAGASGGQYRSVKVHQIPIHRSGKVGPQSDQTDFDSLKPPVPDGTAAPMQYQSLPNRPFVSPRDLPGYGRTPSPTLPSEPTISETDVTPSIETSAPTPTSSMPSTRASLTPSEQIDRALDDLEEIRAQIKTFSSSTKDKTYLYLEDRLDKLLLKFDGIDTGGEDTIRQKRKQAVRETLDAISALEKKLAVTTGKPNNNNNSNNNNTSDTSSLGESFDLASETKSTGQETEHSAKTETEVESALESAQAEKPSMTMEVEAQESENGNNNDQNTPVTADSTVAADSQENTIDNPTTVGTTALESARN